ncbi:HD domain-containing protein [Treponema zuelzerae]|uniref:HD domain-containing protein n=1 Tax=Teretinema zuelzerae TaxID=156 RepID=A0AAE3EJD4_9SPIR|nr:HD domain-containing protein [Teretinema zuelzerae]MCD1656090.1 HD domain-containing protein [Teretinema zuelzerae]
MENSINNIILSMINYNSPDVKRINHALKVFQFSEIIANLEEVTVNELTVIKICGILHDIGIHEAEIKYKSSSGKYQEIEGPKIAEELLVKNKIDISNTQIERIKFIIGNHHSYKKIDGIDFQILVEADFIVNIYEDNIQKREIENVKKNIFMTNTGKYLIDSMYLK